MAKPYWIYSALFTTIVFFGGLASNLVANEIEAAIAPYKPVIWIVFFIALITSIFLAIRESKEKNKESPPSVQTVGDIKINNSEKQDGGVRFDHGSIVKVGGDVVGGNKITTIYNANDSSVSSLHQIPRAPADFIGRKDEQDAILKDFENGVTITGLRGTGGIGKTALALKLAEKLECRYPDAQFFINLQGTSDKPLRSEEAMAQIIRSYYPSQNIPEGQDAIRALYLSVLNDKHALLLLDNAAGKEQVEPLIPPLGCALLVTSRVKFQLPGLQSRDLDFLTSADACNLLLEIAPRIGISAAEIAELCGFLPLALRHSASILAERSDLAVGVFIQKLKEKRVRLEIIEASFTLSYDLLPPNLRERWSQLSIFPGDFDSIAAATIWNEDKDNTMNILGELVQWNLVEYHAPPIPIDIEGAGRYVLHDLARLFADSRLNSQLREMTQTRYSMHYLNLLHIADELYMKGGDGIYVGLLLFDQEWHNIKSGEERTREEANVNNNKQIRMVCCAYPVAGANILIFRLNPFEYIQWLEAANNAAKVLNDDSILGEIFTILGNVYAHLKENQKTIDYCNKALEIQRIHDDLDGEANSLSVLSIAYAQLGDTPNAFDCTEKALSIYRKIGSKRGESCVLGNIGVIISNLEKSKENAEKLITYSEQARSINIEVGDRLGEAHNLCNLGTAYMDLKEYPKAIDYFKNALFIHQEIGDLRAVGNDLCNLSFAYAKLEDLENVIAYLEQASYVYDQIDSSKARIIREKLAQFQNKTGNITS